MSARPAARTHPKELERGRRAIEKAFEEAAKAEAREARRCYDRRVAERRQAKQQALREHLK